MVRMPGGKFLGAESKGKGEFDYFMNRKESKNQTETKNKAKKNHFFMIEWKFHCIRHWDKVRTIQMSNKSKRKKTRNLILKQLLF